MAALSRVQRHQAPMHRFLQGIDREQAHRGQHRLGQVASV
jgi:hypothetical protein